MVTTVGDESKMVLMGQLPFTIKKAEDLLKIGGEVDCDLITNEVIRGLKAFINFLYEVKEQNGAEDRGIPGTNIRSINEKVYRVLTRQRMLTFAIARVKVLNLTIPLRAVDDVAVGPIATAAVVATGDGADAGLPDAAPALRPKLTPIIENTVNEKLMLFGRGFRAKASAKNRNNFKEDPERKELVEDLDKKGDIALFKECPFCCKPATSFIKKANMNRHIRGGRCQEQDFLEHGGVDFKERARKRNEEKARKKGKAANPAEPAEPAEPAVDPAQAGGRFPLPSGYDDYPDKSLRPSQLGRIMLTLGEKATTEESHVMLQQYLQNDQQTKSPVAPLPHDGVDRYLESFDDVLKGNDREEFLTLFKAFVKAARTRWAPRTLRINIYQIFHAGENWLDYLVGIRGDALQIIPRIVNDIFCAKDLKLTEWMDFVIGTEAEQEDILSTRRARSYAGIHLLCFLIDIAKEIRTHHQETTNFVHTAERIMVRLQDFARTCTATTTEKNKRTKDQEHFINKVNPVTATSEKIRAISDEMLPKLYQLMEQLKKDPTNKALLHKLSQGGCYIVGLENGQRPQAYVNLTMADMLTFEEVPAKPGEHDGFWKFSVGVMSKTRLKTANMVKIFVPHSVAKFLTAYRNTRDAFMTRLGVSYQKSLKAPFFLRGSDNLAGLDLKNLRYLWKEAVNFNFKEMRQQASTIQRLAGADAVTLGAHSEVVVDRHYYTAKEAKVTQEMEKVFAYMTAQGLGANLRETPIPAEEAREIQERNQREAEEFIRLEKEEAASKSSTFTSTMLTKKHNRPNSRLACASLILSFACPFLSEEILLGRGLQAVRATRKELNVHR